jgi:Tfp pilus assembly protein PilZ
MIQADHNNKNYAIQRRFKRRNLKCRIGIFLRDDFFFAEAIEISEGGTLLKTPYPIEAGSNIELHFMIPGRINFLAVKGQVIYRIGSRAGDSSNEIGVAFEHLSREVRAVIAEFVDHGA